MQFNPEKSDLTDGIVYTAIIDPNNNENLFDLSLLEELDDKEYVSDILTVILGNSPKELYEMKIACISDKFDAAYSMAHKLRGSTSLLQATSLLNVLIKIEEAAKDGEKDELRNLAQLAIKEYKRIEIPLKQHLKNIEKELHRER
jgi:hypothetical protein